jgi:predicted transposase/invertase (TIGR01784 family)
MQVRRQEYWPNRALFYLSRMIANNLKAGQTYEQMPCAVRIDLLDFDLYPERQARWTFAMRDETLHHRTLTDTAEIRIIEMLKFERLGWDDGPLSDWVKFLKHPKDQAIMQTITTPEVKQAQTALYEMSADEKMRIRLFEEEMYERDRISGLERALREGREEGMEKGLERGLEKGLEKGREEAVLNLIRGTDMGDARIANLMHLPVEQVARLRRQRGH